MGGEIAIRSGLDGLKSKKDVLLGIFWLRGARDSVQDPQGPSFCESGGGGGGKP